MLLAVVKLSNIIQGVNNIMYAPIDISMNTMLPEAHDTPSLVFEIAIFLPVLGLAVWQVVPIVPVAFNSQFLLNKSEVYGERTDHILSFRVHICFFKGFCHLPLNTTYARHVLQYPSTTTYSRAEAKSFYFVWGHLFCYA